MTRPEGSRLGISVALIALVLVAAACGRGAASSPQAAAPSHPSLWFEGATFYGAVRSAESMPAPEGQIAGGIIPHDWLGGRFITSFFRGLGAGDPPSTVILIGPNHDNKGSAGALTSDLSWATPFGVVEPDQERIGALIARDLVAVDNTVLTTEHSVAGIMPAIAYYLPHARVVPIILRGDYGPDETARLAEALAEQAGGDVVIVTAVDFSHDLVQSEAARNDTITLQALRGGDSGRLFTLDNRFLDSPPSIAVLMETMAALGAGPFELLADTNSGALHNDELAPTTSYIVGYYPAGDAGAARAPQPAAQQRSSP
jgi:AmmeMemoRadiSam system protein B